MSDLAPRPPGRGCGHPAGSRPWAMRPMTGFGAAAAAWASSLTGGQLVRPALGPQRRWAASGWGRSRRPPGFPDRARTWAATPRLLQAERTGWAARCRRSSPAAGPAWPARGISCTFRAVGVSLQSGLQSSQGQLVHPHGPGQGVALHDVDDMVSRPRMIPAWGPPSSLSPEKDSTSTPAFMAAWHGGLRRRRPQWGPGPLDSRCPGPHMHRACSGRAASSSQWRRGRRFR